MVLNPFKGALQEALTTKYLTKEEFIGEKDIDLKEFILVEDDIIQKINNLTPPQIQKYKKNYKRDKKISEDRLNLPIMSKEIDLIDSIRNSLVTIVCGTTGSGKSTQLPQML
jgi:HrpA-like RNA helicase